MYFEKEQISGREGEGEDQNRFNFQLIDVGMKREKKNLEMIIRCQEYPNDLWITYR